MAMGWEKWSEAWVGKRLLGAELPADPGGGGSCPHLQSSRFAERSPSSLITLYTCCPLLSWPPQTAWRVRQGHPEQDVLQLSLWLSFLRARSEGLGIPRQ